MTPRLQRLSQSKWELALRVVSKAWEEADSELTSFQAPKELRHLKSEDWEEVCRCLWVLLQQKEQSPIH
jgi:hypothetical protein